MDQHHSHTGTIIAGQATRKSPSSPQCVDSTALFHGTRELVIAHNDNTYYLRITRNEKLILTK